MCLIAFAVGARPGLPLLLAANRDEFFDRPTAPWHRWSLPGGGEVLGGRDLRDGGTWLGVSLCARVAMLTNVRCAQAASGLRSRGELATRWLAGERLDTLQADIAPQAYGGFNLVVGDLKSGAWHWLSNCDPLRPCDGVVPHLTSRSLAPGVYGLSNAALDTPWPKTLRLKAAVAEAVQTASSASPPSGWESGLARALADETEAPIDQLPATGIELSREIGLSSPFVRLPGQGYGTRSSLVLRIAATEDEQRWQLDAHEWTHTPLAPGQPHHWDDTRRRSEFLLLGT
jgi:uncharacterized protein with NRDE domain